MQGPSSDHADSVAETLQLDALYRALRHEASATRLDLVVGSALGTRVFGWKTDSKRLPCYPSRMGTTACYALVATMLIAMECEKLF